MAGNCVQPAAEQLRQVCAQAYLCAMLVCSCYPSNRGYGHHVVGEVHKYIHTVPVPHAVEVWVVTTVGVLVI